MRKLVVGEFLSLDGVMEAPDQWHFPYFNDEMAAVTGAQLAGSDTLLIGRVTYESFAGAFADAAAGDPVAAMMNGIQKVVVSRTLTELPWQNSTVLEGDLVDGVTELKQSPGRDIAVTGSGRLVQSLLRAGLVDELNLLVHPIVVGTGEPLFAPGDEVPLQLVSSAAFQTGVLHLVYRPVGSSPGSNENMIESRRRPSG